MAGLMHSRTSGVYKEVMGHTHIHFGPFAALKEETKHEDLSVSSAVKVVLDRVPLRVDQLL